MSTRRHSLLLAFLPIATVLLTTTVGAQMDQHAIAQQLLRGDVAERGRALGQTWGFEPQMIGAELRAALITLLERNNRIVAEAAKRKEPLARFEDPEFVAHVAHAVSQLEDPQAIPALAGALGTGSTLVVDALADFGERAAPAVLGVVTSPGSRISAVHGGLITLRFIVERASRSPLSAATLEQIRRTAEQHLTIQGQFARTGVTLRWAIDLAVALKDPGLRGIVEALASDPNEVIAKGVTDPQLIEQTQKWAAERLAGVPPQPRYRSPAERSRLLGPDRSR
jgi:hypothetical protein